MTWKKRKALLIAVIAFVFAGAIVFGFPDKFSFRRIHLDKKWIWLSQSEKAAGLWPNIINNRDTDRPLGIGVEGKLYGFRLGNALLKFEWVYENPLE